MTELAALCHGALHERLDVASDLLFGMGRDHALCERQRPDGSRDEPQFTGTGFPGDFMINYHGYRHYFPVTARARFCP